MTVEAAAARGQLARHMEGLLETLEAGLRDVLHGGEAPSTSLESLLARIRLLSAWQPAPKRRHVALLVKACRPLLAESGQADGKSGDGRLRALALFYRLYKNEAARAGTLLREAMRVRLHRFMSASAQGGAGGPDIHQAREQLGVLCRFAGFGTGGFGWRRTPDVAMAGELLALEAGLEEGNGEPDVTAVARHSLKAAWDVLLGVLCGHVAGLVAILEENGDSPAGDRGPGAPARIVGQALPLLAVMGFEKTRRELLLTQALLYRRVCRTAPGTSPDPAQVRRVLAGIHLELAERRAGSRISVEPPACLSSLREEWGRLAAPAAALQERGLYECALAEFGAHHGCLEQALRRGRTDRELWLTSDLVTVAYKLALNSRTLELPAFAGILPMAGTVLTWHWVNQAPVSPELASAFARLTAALLDYLHHGRVNDRPALYMDESVVARHFLACRGRSGPDSIVFRMPSANGDAEQKQEIPRLLVDHIHLLLSLSAEDLSSFERLERIIDRLVFELKVLEKGAAGLKVHRIEAMACVLIEVHEELLYRRQSRQMYPVGALTRAHATLAAMLNQAAAWQEVVTGRREISRLYGWLEQVHCRALPGGLIKGMHDRCRAMEAAFGELLETLQSEENDDIDPGNLRDALAGRVLLLREMNEQLIIDTGMADEELSDATHVAFSRLVPDIRRSARQIGAVLDRHVHVAFDNTATRVERGGVDRILQAIRHVLAFMLGESGGESEARRWSGLAGVPTIELSHYGMNGTLYVVLCHRSARKEGNRHRLQTLHRRLGADRLTVEKDGERMCYRLGFPDTVSPE